MDDILHILELLRARAEADLMALTTCQNQCLAEIEKLKQSLARDMNGAAHLSNMTDIYVRENWRTAQLARIKTLEKTKETLAQDIVKAKEHFKTILAKYLSASALAKQANQAAQIRKEELEAEAQMDVFRQKQSAKK